MMPGGPVGNYHQTQAEGRETQVRGDWGDQDNDGDGSGYEPDNDTDDYK